ETMAEGARLPEVEAALEPLREKLALSVEAVTRRVEALERYADRVRSADEVLRAQRHLEAIAEKSREYDELIADTVRDDLALPGTGQSGGERPCLARGDEDLGAHTSPASGDDVALGVDEQEDVAWPHSETLGADLVGAGVGLGHADAARVGERLETSEQGAVA